MCKFELGNIETMVKEKRFCSMKNEVQNSEVTYQNESGRDYSFKRRYMVETY